MILFDLVLSGIITVIIVVAGVHWCWSPALLFIFAFPLMIVQGGSIDEI